MRIPAFDRVNRDWQAWINPWITDMRVHGNTEQTITHWHYQICFLARYTGASPDTITSTDIIAWLSRGVSPNTVRSDFNAATAFFTWAQRAKYRDDNPMIVVPMVKRVKHKQIPAPQEAVNRGLSHPNPQIRLMVLMLHDTGMRRTELSIAHTKDIIDDLYGKSIIVHGKGHKDRVVPLSNQLIALLDAVPDGYIFPGDVQGHICADTVYRWVKEATGYPPHAFRRKFATDMWRATHDPLKVKEFLGHESLDTTQAYIQTSINDLYPAISALTNYRQHEGIPMKRPERLLQAYNVPDVVIQLFADAIATRN